MYTYIYMCVLIHMHMYTIYTRDYAYFIDPMTFGNHLPTVGL